jgi:hypothetical protein
MREGRWGRGEGGRQGAFVIIEVAAQGEYKPRMPAVFLLCMMKRLIT